MADRPEAPKVANPKDEQAKRKAINDAAAKANEAAGGNSRAGTGQQNRGYNYSSYNPRTGEASGNNPQTGAYQFNERTGQMSGNVPNDAIQQAESSAFRNQLEIKNIENEIKSLESSRAGTYDTYGNSSRGFRNVATVRTANVDQQIAALKAQAAALKERSTTNKTNYSGVMTTSGKIYENKEEATRQGQTVMKDRQGRDVTFEGDIRSSAGYGQSGRGYNYSTTGNGFVEGASPDKRTNENPTGSYYNDSTGNYTMNKSGQYTRPMTSQESDDYAKTHGVGRIENTFLGLQNYQQSETGFPQVTNEQVITNRTGSGTYSDPFKSNQPEENQLAGFANPTWTVNTKSQGKKTFQDKKDVDAYIKANPNDVINSNEKMSPYNPNFITQKFTSVPQRFTVGDRTFKSKEHADEFIQRTSTAQNANTSKSSTDGGIIGFTSLTGDVITSKPSESTYITQKGMAQGPQQPRKDTITESTNYLDNFIKRRSDVVSQYLGGLAQSGLSMFAGSVALENLGGKYFVEAIRGKPELGTPVPPKTPNTFDVGITSGVVSGAVKTYQTGDIKQFGGEVKSGLEQSLETIKKQPLAVTLGQVTGFITPVGGGKLKALSPIKSESFKAVTESGKVATIARTVDVGYGQARTTLLTKTKVLSLGDPLKSLKKSRLEEIEATDRGLELTTQGRLGTKILTSQEGLGILQKAGKVLPRDVQSVSIAKEQADIIKFSAKNVPNEIRQKTSVMPENPVTSVRPGKESKILNEEILPSMPTAKGTLSETMQLDRDLLKPVKPQTPQKPGEVIDPRSRSTGDIDVDFPKTKIGEIQANRAGTKAVEKLSKNADPDRTFFKQGTNVFGQTKNEPPEEILNILTKKDEKTGYLNKNELRPFGIKLKERIIKVKSSPTSSKNVRFVSIEQNALNRIESTLSLQGPKTDKFKGVTEEIPYLTDKYKDIGIQRTEKGYTVLSTEHRLKDMSKLQGQDAVQIGRNLITAGYTKQGSRMLELVEKQKSLYPEVKFQDVSYPKEIAYESTPSKLSSIGSSINKNKEYANPILVSSSGQVLQQQEKPREVIQSRSISSIGSRPSISSRSTNSLFSDSKSTVSNSSISMSRPSNSSISPSVSMPNSSSSPSNSNSKSASKPSNSKPSFFGSKGPSVWGKSPSSFYSKSSGATRSTGSSFASPSSLTVKLTAVPTITPTPNTIQPPIRKPLFGDNKNKPKKDKLPKRKHVDFLGNTKTNAIEGLFRRTEIITGDKKTEKQVIKDKKATFNPKYGLGYSNKKKLKF